MIDPVIACPNCLKEIKLTESLAAPLIASTRLEYEQKIADYAAEIAKREASVRLQLQEIAEAKAGIDELVAEKLRDQRGAIAAEESKKARALLQVDLENKAKLVADLQEILQEREAKLAAAQQTQADLLRKQRELDDAKRELDLTIERQVQASLAQVRAKAKSEAEEDLRLKLMEKEQLIGSMQKQIEDLKHKAEQGSEQLQGEVLELHLENVLRNAFDMDSFEPVPKGEHGGDLLHRVHGTTRPACGTILWESKRTKNWSDLWLSKLREDQRAAKADLAIIVTQALPKNVESFDHVDGVWVTGFRTAVPLAMVLRSSLIELASARQTAEGQQSKMEMVYQYLTGTHFRHRVQAIVEKFTELREDLDKERKTMTKLWAKREAQICCVLDATAGMYGDLQGIVGKTLLEIEGLDIPLLEGNEPAELNGALPFARLQSKH